MVDAMVEDVEGVAVEDVGGTQLCYHHQEAQLSHVEDAGSRDGAREEVDGWSWGPGVQVLELLQPCLLLGRDGGDLGSRRG